MLSSHLTAQFYVWSHTKYFECGSTRKLDYTETSSSLPKSLKKVELLSEIIV